MKSDTKPTTAAPAARVSATTVRLRPLGRELRNIALAYTATIISLSLIFQPLTWWPLTFVCLTPWALATCVTDRAWIAHWLSFLGGWVFFMVNLSWLRPVTGLGFVALAFYLALYWTLAAWALRTARRRGISPIWTLPVIWVACEYLRAFVMTGFPWLFLAHSFAGVLPLIQISDLTGAYGVSFLAAMVNGVITEIVLHWRGWLAARPRRKQLVVGTAVCASAVAGSLGYGYFRLGQARDFMAGPRVAVIQEDFPLISTPPYGDPPWVIFARYLALGAEAALETQPDLVVFPETVWASTQNKEYVAGIAPSDAESPRWVWLYSRLCHTAVAAFARGDYADVNAQLDQLETTFGQRGSHPQSLPRLPAGPGPAVAVVVGSKSVEFFPEQAYPRSKEYNSALLYYPDGEQHDARYDKTHLVPFGEFVPFRYGRLHWLYRRLNALSPFSGKDGTHEYSLSSGDEWTVMPLVLSGADYRFGTPICYEDVMPYVARRFVWDGSERRVDFLVNISNDGWFLHSAELPQHLAICVFRAVENRVSIVRSVNTGISAFIDSNGRKYALVRAADGRLYRPDADGRGVVGYHTDQMQLDGRASLYGRVGDWLPRICLFLAAVLWIEGVIERWIWGLRQRILAWSRRQGATNVPEA